MNGPAADEPLRDGRGRDPPSAGDRRCRPRLSLRPDRPQQRQRPTAADRRHAAFTPGTLQTFAPNGVPLGSRYGRAGPNTYTLEPDAFDRVLTDVLRGSRPMPMPESYIDRGYWIELTDRCVVGIRWSKNHGITMELIKGPDGVLPDKPLKLHRSGK